MERGGWAQVGDGCKPAIGSDNYGRETPDDLPRLDSGASRGQAVPAVLATRRPLAPASYRKRRSWLDPKPPVLAAALLAPAFLLLALIVLYPVGRLVWTSFFELNLTSGLPATFAGGSNYASVVEDPVFWQTLKNTVVITVITVPGALVAGMALALIANLPFRRRWPVRLALLVPWALPLAFTGLIFAWFFNSQYGVVDDLLRRTGLPQPIWFNSGVLATGAICVTIIWKSSSFVALILFAGLQTIPRELYEAADVDGAGRLRQFVSVTLPMLRPAIVVAMIFRTITALQTFDIPFTMTRGGPGDATRTLAMYIYQNTVDFLDLGYGSTLAVVMFLLSMAISVIYLRQIRAQA
jgi:multiple sugar transport system permease protein